MKSLIHSPLTETSDFRLATRADKGRVIDILTAAFWDDPQILWFSGDGPDKETKIRAMMAFAFEERFPAGDVFISKDENAAAIWKRDFRSRYSFPLFGEYLRFLRTYDFSDIRDITRLDKEISKRYPIDDPYYYLWILGVHPDHQGKGLSKKMVVPVLEEAEAQNIPVYLETSKSRNIRIYEKRGFGQYDEMVVNSRDPFRLFYMRTSS